MMVSSFFFQAEDGIRDYKVTGVQTCALPIYPVATRNLDSDLGYDTDVLQDKHDERQARLSGRQNRHVEALFRLLHTTSPGRRHDVLGNHRNTSTVPASMLGAVTEAPTRFSAWYGHYPARAGQLRGDEDWLKAPSGIGPDAPDLLRGN